VALVKIASNELRRQGAATFTPGLVNVRGKSEASRRYATAYGETRLDTEGR